VTGRAGLNRDVLVFVCAISAGVHTALAPEHLEEHVALGMGFLLSAVLLAVLAVALTDRPSRLNVATAAVLLSGLIVGWLLAVTTGLPVLLPDAEDVETIAVLTKAVELVGLVVAARLLTAPGRAQGRPAPLGLTALVALFSALAALAMSGHHHGAHVDAGETPAGSASR
jgi:hypothetical protein